LDNTKLINLLTDYNQDQSNDKYAHIVNELLGNEAYLLLPSIHDNTNMEQWKTIHEASTLKLTSVYNLDGLKVLGAFTSEEAIFSWAKKPMQYTAMESGDVLKLCQANGIDRIVIDSHLPTMFVLERNRGDVTVENITKDSPIRIGTPAKRISGADLEKLRNNFSDVITTEEAYQYLMTRDQEHSLILAFKLSVNTDNSRKATINAIQKAFQGEYLELPVDAYFIEDNTTYENIKKVGNSLIYSK